MNEGSKAKEEKEREKERQLYIQVGATFTLVVTGRPCAIVWDTTRVSSALYMYKILQVPQVL
jgi:hypothetical protein